MEAGRRVDDRRTGARLPRSAFRCARSQSPGASAPLAPSIGHARSSGLGRGGSPPRDPQPDDSRPGETPRRDDPRPGDPAPEMAPFPRFPAGRTARTALDGRLPCGRFPPGRLPRPGVSLRATPGRAESFARLAIRGLPRRSPNLPAPDPAASPRGGRLSLPGARSGDAVSTRFLQGSAAP